MSSETHTAIINVTLLLASLAFILVVSIGYFTGATVSSMVVKGLSSLAVIGMLGWLVLRLVALRSVLREMSPEREIAQNGENPFAALQDEQL